MPLLIPTASEDLLLSLMLKESNEDYTLKLFVNNVTPGNADTAATYTEMSTLGYAAKTILPADWTIAQNGSAEAEATAPQEVWTFTAGTLVTVYGYFVVRATAGTLLWAERFASSIPVQNTGDSISVTPVFTFRSKP